MRQVKEELPVIMDVPGAHIQSEDWGNMVTAHMRFGSGTDFTPLLEGLPGDMCQCPHWGYVIEGSVNVRYSDGTEEVVRAGDVYYWPPGHTVWFDEDTQYVEFSPSEEMHEVLHHVERKMNG